MACEAADFGPSWAERKKKKKARQKFGARMVRVEQRTHTSYGERSLEGSAEGGRKTGRTAAAAPAARPGRTGGDDDDERGSDDDARGRVQRHRGKGKTWVGRGKGYVAEAERVEPSHLMMRYQKLATGW
jgi:hypothetical protein